MMKKFYILVEGDTEKKLLVWLGVIGKIEIVNLWDKDIKKILRKIKPNTDVFVIYDTDVQQSQANIERFNDNLKILKRDGYLKGILQQTLNFEDELIYACKDIKNVKELFKLFHAVNADEFKSNFLDVNNGLAVLERVGFDKAKLWQQPISDKILAIYHDYRMNLDGLPKR